MADPADLDTAAFTALNTANSSVLGFYAKDPITVLEAGDEVLASVGAVAWFTRASALLTVKRFEDPNKKTSVTTLSNFIEITTREVELPVRGALVRFRKNHTVLSEEQIAASAPDYRKDFARKKWVRAYEKDWSYQANGIRSRRMEQNTLLTVRDDAAAEAERDLALFAIRRAFSVTVPIDPATNLDRFDVVTLEYVDLDKWGLDQTRLNLSDEWLVLGITEESKRGSTELVVWQ